MSTPPYVPVSLDQLPRRGDLQDFPPPRRPVARPAEITGPQPRGAGLGTPTPDAGYALLLARRLSDRLQLAGGELLDDALWAGAVLGMKRAGLVGRGPILADVERGLAALGYLGGASDDMVAWRRRTFFGIERDYHLQRAVADRFSQEMLNRLVPELIAELHDWRATFAGLPGVATAAVSSALAPVTSDQAVTPIAAQRRSRPRRATANRRTGKGRLHLLANRRQPVAASSVKEDT